MSNTHGYAGGQLAKAFVTALTHEDAATRRRAEERVERWRSVLAGMAEGTVRVGSRVPVAGLPVWVTPEVVRGGFATGAAAAGGALLPYEREAADRAGVAAERRALFAHYVTDAGLAELNALLDGAYDVVAPEEAALLFVAWLLQAGDRLGALSLLETIAPFTDRLRFAPRPASAPTPEASMVWRETAGQVSERLAAKRPHPAVTAMNEALTVWNPLADELLRLWLDTVENRRVAAVEPAGWRERAAELLDRYAALAGEHTLCTKHRKPKENLAILRTAVEDTLAGRTVRRGLLQHAVDAMVRRRGLPGSPEHTALRLRQSAVAARPTHHRLAQLVLARLTTLPNDRGVADTESLTGPVTAEEAQRTGIPTATPLPASLRGIVERALSAPVETLVERGIVPSAEVLAELVPQLVATAIAGSYTDERLRTLMAATYRAFRNRRSLLLLNLEHQVRIEELPWVGAVARYRDRSAGAAPRTALVQLGELALQAFPATALPNPLIRELGALARAAHVEVPLVEELAADIFMGTFSAKFLQAAKLAGRLLDGSLYARYYGIDYKAIQRMAPGAETGRRFRVRTSYTFDELCRLRAGAPVGGYSVAANGAVIEQAQILTTHNLAALIRPIGAQPTPGWDYLAQRTFDTVCRLVTRVHNNTRPMPTVKDAAYAWRQMLFYLAMAETGQQSELATRFEAETGRFPGHTAKRLAPALAGLRHVIEGGSLDDPAGSQARRFLGWSLGPHWMCDPTAQPDEHGMTH